MEQNIETKSTFKQIITILVVIVCGAIGYFSPEITTFLFPPSFEKNMAKYVKETNSKCPIMIDDYSRCDSVNILSEKTLQFNYALVSIVKSDVEFEVIKEELETNLVSNVKNSHNFKIFRENKIAIMYSFKDKNGAFIGKILIEPKQYLK